MRCNFIIDGYIHRYYKSTPSDLTSVIFNFYCFDYNSIKVFARIRPQNAREKYANGYIITKISDDNKTISIKLPDGIKTHQFSFEHIFDWISSQAEIYDKIGPSFIGSIFNGNNTSIIHYGQKAAGKTYTMKGKLESPHRGFIPRIIDTLFEKIASSENIYM